MLDADRAGAQCADVGAGSCPRVRADRANIASEAPSTMTPATAVETISQAGGRLWSCWIDQHTATTIAPGGNIASVTPGNMIARLASVFIAKA